MSDPGDIELTAENGVVVKLAGRRGFLKIDGHPIDKSASTPFAAANLSKEDMARLGAALLVKSGGARTVQQEADLDQVAHVWVQEINQCHVVVDGVREFDHAAAAEIMLKALTAARLSEDTALLDWLFQESAMRDELCRSFGIRWGESIREALRARKEQSRA